jgi:hypothetical protein
VDNFEFEENRITNEMEPVQLWTWKLLTSPNKHRASGTFSDDPKLLDELIEYTLDKPITN